MASNSGSKAMKSTAVVVAVVMVAVMAALAIGYALHPSDSGDIAVTLTEYHITITTTLSAGRHTFGVTDIGGDRHEFVIFATDLRANALPRDGSGVDEESPLLHSVADSGSSLRPGEHRRITATLKPGHYVVVCNLPTHYGLGMHVDLTVTAA